MNWELTTFDGGFRTAKLLVTRHVYVIQLFFLSNLSIRETPKTQE